MATVPQTPLGTGPAAIPAIAGGPTPGLNTFGAGEARATERLGGIVAQQGDRLGKIAVDMQRRATNKAVDDAFLTFNGESTKLLYGDGKPGDDPYFGTRNEAAVARHAPTLDMIQASQNRIAASLPEGPIRDQFEAKAGASFQQQQASIGKHAQSQQQSAEKITNEAMIQDATTTAMREAARDDPNILNIEMQMEVVAAQAAEAVEAAGITDEAASGTLVRRAQSRAMAEVIVEASKTNSPFARQLLDEWSEIDPATGKASLERSFIGDLEDTVRKAEDTDTMLRFLAEIKKEATDLGLSELEAKQVAEANANDLPPDVVVSTMKHLGYWYDDKRQEEKDTFNDAVGNANEAILKGKDWVVYQKENPEEAAIIARGGGGADQEALQARVAAGQKYATTSDGVTMAKALSEIRDDPNANISAHQAKVTEGEWNKIQAAQGTAQGRDSLSADKKTAFTDARAALPRLYKGVRWSDKGKKKAWSGASEAIEAMDAFVAGFVNGTPSRVPTQKEVNEEAHRIMSPLYVNLPNTGSGFGTIRLPASAAEEEWDRFGAQRHLLTEAQRKVVIVPWNDIPPGRYSDIVKEMQERGIEPNDVSQETFEQIAGAEVMEDVARAAKLYDDLRAK